MLIGSVLNLPLETKPVGVMPFVNDSIGALCFVAEEPIAEAAIHAINNHDKMAEMLTLHRSIFVHMLENIAPTATIEDVEKVQDLVASIDEVLGDE